MFVQFRCEHMHNVHVNNSCLCCPLSPLIPPQAKMDLYSSIPHSGIVVRSGSNNIVVTLESPACAIKYTVHSKGFILFCYCAIQYPLFRARRDWPEAFSCALPIKNAAYKLVLFR